MPRHRWPLTPPTAAPTSAVPMSGGADRMADDSAGGRTAPCAMPGRRLVLVDMHLARLVLGDHRGEDRRASTRRLTLTHAPEPSNDDQPRRQMSSLVASWLACRLPRPLPRCVRRSTRKRLGVTSRRSRSAPTPPRRTRKSPSTSPTRRSRRPNTRYGCQRPRRQQRWKHLNLDPPIDEAALAKNRPLRVIGLSGRRTGRSRY
jgi:hypothetical protein